MEFQVYDFALVPVIIGLVQLLKSFGLSSKLGSVAAILLGLLAGFVYIAPGDPLKAILSGLVLGLSASGLYSDVKNIRY